jgi:hypothetical protein
MEAQDLPLGQSPTGVPVDNATSAEALAAEGGEFKSAMMSATNVQHGLLLRATL